MLQAQALVSSQLIIMALRWTVFTARQCCFKHRKCYWPQDLGAAHAGSHEAFPVRGCRLSGFRICICACGLRAAHPACVHDVHDEAKACRRVRFLEDFKHVVAAHSTMNLLPACRILQLRRHNVKSSTHLVPSSL